MMINDQCMIKRLTTVVCFNLVDFAVFSQKNFPWICEPLLFALPTLDILTRGTLEGYRGG